MVLTEYYEMWKPSMHGARAQTQTQFTLRDTKRKAKNVHLSWDTRRTQKIVSSRHWMELRTPTRSKIVSAKFVRTTKQHRRRICDTSDSYFAQRGVLTCVVFRKTMADPLIASFVEEPWRRAQNFRSIKALLRSHVGCDGLTGTFDRYTTMRKENTIIS